MFSGPTGPTGRHVRCYRHGFPDIAWRDIRDTRYYVAHHDDAVLDDLIWETLNSCLPELVERLTGHR